MCGKPHRLEQQGRGVLCFIQGKNRMCFKLEFIRSPADGRKLLFARTYIQLKR